MNSADWDSFGEAYDFGSIMQYDGMSFSKNGQPTIINKQTGKATVDLNKISQSDRIQINKMYPCETGPTPTQTTKTTRTTARPSTRSSTRPTTRLG